jgi:hypothetical protein
MNSFLLANKDYIIQKSPNCYNAIALTIVFADENKIMFDSNMTIFDEENDAHKIDFYEIIEVMQKAFNNQDFYPKISVSVHSLVRGKFRRVSYGQFACALMKAINKFLNNE